ncbi:MAG: divergent polysaccharide deacetylase family protein [Candidatus Omnitrophota bacterium]
MNKYKKIILILSIAIIFEAAVISILWMSRKELKPQKKAPLPAAVSRPKDLGKIAIVVDDWGYNVDTLDLLKQIKYPLTLAILPNLNYSVRISKEAYAQNKEVILHLPMEPNEKVHIEKNTIMTFMDEKSIKKILNDDLDSIAYAKGVSNHMGSVATADLRTISVIFEELKKRGLYFLDSLVSSDSICNNVAGGINLAFAKRNVFLDNEGNIPYIEQQINILKSKARQYGYAIGIGHARSLTLEVLKKAMPEAAKEGYKFVYVSELVRGVEN